MKNKILAIGSFILGLLSILSGIGNYIKFGLLNPFSFLIAYVFIRLAIKTWNNDFTCKAAIWKIIIFYIVEFLFCTLVASFIGGIIFQSQEAANWIAIISILLLTKIYSPSKFFNKYNKE